MTTNKTEMTHDQRRQILIKLLQDGTFKSSGSKLFTLKFNPETGQRGVAEAGSFVLAASETDPEKAVVWFATPNGVPIFEAKELEQAAVDANKKAFLEELDVVLRANKQKELLDI